VRDLPVLVVAGDLAELCADLGDSAIEVTVPPGLPGTADPSAGHSVALLNTGTPGTVAKLGEGLYLNLMRSCSTWPSGVWIDGPLRTAPDRSSLSWQHWSHTYRYALVAGEGDWRAAGFVRAGQEYNHTVLAREATAHPGEPPSRTGLLSVEPDTVVLTTLKPAGNALAAARPGESTAEAVTVRVYESAGRPASARVSLFTGIESAQVSDPLEGGDGSAADPGALPLGPAEIATLRLRPAGGRSGAAVLGPSREPAQPVFARYWLHNKGPAPLGNLPAAVHLSPSRVTGAGQVRLTVAASGRAAAGRVELDVPDGITVAAPALDYDLAPGEYAGYRLDVEATGAPAGTYFLGARIRDDLDQVVEDVAAIEVGPVSADPLEVQLSDGPLRLVPGASGEIVVWLSNAAGSPVRGEAQLLSPYGTWGADADVQAGPWTRGFEVAAGGTTEVPFGIRTAPTARRGAWWALVKVVYFGRLHYTRTIGIEVVP
jgi:hypothetical protein